MSKYRGGGFASYKGRAARAVLADVKFSGKVTPDLQRMAADAGKAYMGLVLERTVKGEGPDGPFDQYSLDYAWKRLNAGLPAGTVNLTWTGEMLRSLKRRKRRKKRGRLKDQYGPSNETFARHAFHVSAGRRWLTAGVEIERKILRLLQRQGPYVRVKRGRRA